MTDFVPNQYLTINIPISGKGMFKIDIQNDFVRICVLKTFLFRLFCDTSGLIWVNLMHLWGIYFQVKSVSNRYYPS